MSGKNVCWGSGGCWSMLSSWQWLCSSVVIWVQVFVWMVDTLNVNFEHMTFWCRFADTGFRKVDWYVQSGNIAWNVLLLCLRLLHGTAATKRMCSRKFLHQVLWHSLAKLYTKNYENSSTVVKVTVKKSVAPFLCGHDVDAVAMSRQKLCKSDTLVEGQCCIVDCWLIGYSVSESWWH